MTFSVTCKPRRWYKLSLLISHPFLFKEFEHLRAYISKDELLGAILAIFDELFDQLPEDEIEALYYILGATVQHTADITEILKRTNVFNLIETPEKAFDL